MERNEYLANLALATKQTPKWQEPSICRHPYTPPRASYGPIVRAIRALWRLL